MKFGKSELTIKKRPLGNGSFREVEALCSYKNNNNNSENCQLNSDFKNFKKGGICVDVKERMAKVGMTQVDMILALQKRGCTVQPPMLSSILRGTYTYPKAKQILSVCEQILEEHESA